ncbi:MAG: DUF1501 domain-containing protein [Rhodanobacter sp.]
MHISKIADLQRREFLRRALIMGGYGLAAPLVSTLGLVGAASAAGAPTDYRALVCVFLFGGNDYGNTLVPYDQPGYDAYNKIRLTLATARDDLAGTVLKPSVALPGGRVMALAPGFAPMMPIFNAGNLAVMLNVGNLVQPTSLAQYKANSVPLPPKLFSHADQLTEWQTSGPASVNTGWGGRIADLVMGVNTYPTFSSVNVSSNAVFMAGKKANQYQMSSSGPIAINGLNKSIYGSSGVPTALRALITSPRSQWLEQDLNAIASRSIDAQASSSAALAAVPAFATPYDSTNALARQLQTVARMIAARKALGAGRQVFFVSMGGFDLHDSLVAKHPALLATLASAMTSFYGTTVELGVANQVTAFTASDFGRTLSSNGDGTDHGWGSHHLVMGGAVNGGRFYGQLPDISVNGPDDVGQGRLLPTTGVDQLASTLGKWMGVSDTDITTVVPQISNYSARNLGFMTA